MDATLKQKAARIQLAVFDVDGVMTDGGLIHGNDGNEFKIFHVHDGLGLVMLRDAGVEIGVISSRSSIVVSTRMEELGIEHVYQGEKDKQMIMQSLMKKLNVPQNCTAYTGDDLIDLPAMSAAGLSIAVANARPEVKASADWTTVLSGGKGAVREVCEMLLEARGELETCLRKYSRH